MVNRILFLSLLALFSISNKLTAQHTHHDSDNRLKGEYEIFNTDIEGFKFSLTSSLYPLVVGKNIVFGIKGTSLDNETQFKPHIIFLNISNSGKNSIESKLVFSRQEAGGKYILDYTFGKTGKYNFEVEVQNEDSLAVNKIYRFAFTQLINEIDEGDDADSHNSGMGMGSMMLIVMGAVMLGLMVLIGMSSANHR
jgi:hypothetical protein